jgi:hypothetical protein
MIKVAAKMSRTTTTDSAALRVYLSMAISLPTALATTADSSSGRHTTARRSACRPLTVVHELRQRHRSVGLGCREGLVVPAHCYSHRRQPPSASTTAMVISDAVRWGCLQPMGEATQR